MKRVAALSVLGFALPVCSLIAFEEIPWFGVPLEAYLNVRYTYAEYNKVQNAHPPLRNTSHSHLICTGLDFVASPVLDAGMEIEVTHTPRLDWAVRSMAVQGRYLWLDDIVGDPITFNTGVIFRWVPPHSLTDISTPYHARYNTEVNAAVGKEWGGWKRYLYRSYGFLGIGMAETGYPWLRTFMAGDCIYDGRFQYTLFAASYWGFGSHQNVDIKHFDGYAHLHHQSIDLGIQVRYLMEIWGSFSFDYAHRVYAHSFPQNVNFFTVRYQLPFSLF